MQFPYSGAAPGVFTSSPALSLALADAAGRDGGGGGKARDASEAENESRSGSDHHDVISSGGGGGDGNDDDDAEPGNTRKRKKRYHRHTPQQIQELESLFKECPHPDDKLRTELSKRLRLEPRQVKFWFQNRRTQMKVSDRNQSTRLSINQWCSSFSDYLISFPRGDVDSNSAKAQMDRHENALLKQENDKLRTENLSMREAMRNPVCGGCGGPAMLTDVPFHEHDLRVENARLRDELGRVCALTAKFLGKPLSAMAPPLQIHHQRHRPVSGSSSLELAVGGVMPSSTITDFAGAMSGSMGTVITPIKSEAGVPSAMAGIGTSLFMELAMSAMDELVKMAQMGEPLWIPISSEAASLVKETLNFEEYINTFLPCIGVRPEGYVTEASRESGIVIIDDSAAIVETLMDEVRRWSDMFSCMIAKASTIEEISTGVVGTRNGALLLMQAELQVLSPLVPVRELTFLRFSKQLAEGVWAVVDVSADELMRDQGLTSVSTNANMNCRRLPSGCVLEDTPNGFCKVTWVEHTEYDEASVHQLYRPLLRSGLALGAGRWIATLQRQCECLAILMSSIALPENDSAATIHPEGKRSMLKLARRMTENFCAGVSTSSARDWSKMDGLTGNIGEDVHVMARKSVDEPGTPPGVVLSAATSVWMPVMPEQLFNFLRNERLRAEWDILSNGGPMQEVTSISKGQLDGNSVCLLKASPTSANQNSMLILQETCTDTSGSMVVYAPVDIPAMHLVMSGGDSTCVALLPSGFAILPAGPSTGPGHKMGGTLLTVAFQILVNSQPTAKLTVESVETVNNLISCTINKIKTALHCDV
uniref:Homeobox domain-containing protein n=1 Tax=Leersia perrieri TaxID=77586 RepID=A0A0D9W8C9_9ORYZ